MPLSCKSPDGREYAFHHDDASWKLLAVKNRSERHLRTECCEHPVVLKTSPLGTRFFAHARRGTCKFEAESKEHLLAKDTIARAALSIGWRAETEARSLDSKLAWIADVLCSRPGRSARVAFEVQWTRQTRQESERRQAVYQAGGVRALWLMRQSDVPISRNAPAFRLVFVPEVTSQFQVWLPSSHHPSIFDWRSKDNEGDWGQRVDLAAFVRGTLSGALKFAPIVEEVVPVCIELVSTDCWKCRASIRVVRSFYVRSEARWKGFEGFSFGLGELEELPGSKEWVRSHLPPERLAALGAGELKLRYSKTMADRYLSNGCIHCGALQGRFFEHELGFETPICVDAEMKITKDFLERSGNMRAMCRWWFDEDLEASR